MIYMSLMYWNRFDMSGNYKLNIYYAHFIVKPPSERKNILLSNHQINNGDRKENGYGVLQ